MNELQEIKDMVVEQMETTGFVRPTLFVVGDKSRFRYLCTSFPAGLDEAIAPMYRFGTGMLFQLEIIKYHPKQVQ